MLSARKFRWFPTSLASVLYHFKYYHLFYIFEYCWESYTDQERNLLCKKQKLETLGTLLKN